MGLEFSNAKSAKEIKSIHDYTIDAFSDTPDFNWTLEEIKNEIKDGWTLQAAKNKKGEVVAALFYRKDGSNLLTKNTGLKIHHQGCGYSHAIKEHFEKIARENKCKTLTHFCRIDNFRMYSLNESHGYKKTDKKYSDGQVVEWVKKL